MKKNRGAAQAARESAIEKLIFTALAVVALAIVAEILAAPAFAGPGPGSSLSSPGILGLAAGAVVAAIYIAWRKR